MFGVLINLPPRKRVKKLQKDARKLVGRGRHRAEALREVLPEPATLVAEIRGQALPAVEAAREQAERAREQAERVRRRRNRRRPSGVIVVAALIALGAVVAYLLFARRDMEPAYLASSPDEPDTAPAGDPGPSGEERRGTTSEVRTSDAQSSQNPAASVAGTRTTEPVTATSQAPSFGGVTNGYGATQQPRAAWDLPSPSSRGTTL
jgi:hypothetical protein